MVLRLDDGGYSPTQGNAWDAAMPFITWMQKGGIKLDTFMKYADYQQASLWNIFAAAPTKALTTHDSSAFLIRQPETDTSLKGGTLDYRDAQRYGLNTGTGYVDFVSGILPGLQAAIQRVSTGQPLAAPKAAGTPTPSSGALHALPGSLAALKGGNVNVNINYPSGPPTPTHSQLAAQLKSLKFAMPFDVSKYIDKAIAIGGPDVATVAENLIMSSPEFKHYYKGIFNRDGTMKMKPADYDQTFQQIQHYAASQGFQINRSQFGTEVGGNVSPDEMKFRVDSAAQIKSNRDVLMSFNQVLAAQGKKQITSAQQAMDLLNGMSTKRTYDAYETATMLAAAKEAGLGTSVHQAAQAAGSTVGVTSFEDAQKSFAQIASDLADYGSRLSSYGITQQDLQTIQFGGPNRASVAAKAQMAINQAKAQEQVGSQTGEEIGFTQTGAPVTRNQQQATQ